MKHHDGTITNLDRIALSHALHEVAEGFMHEADVATGERIPAEYRRSARLLAEIARGVLNGRADYAKAEAFHEAGRIKLGQAIAARRFFTALTTPPNRTKEAQRD